MTYKHESECEKCILHTTNDAERQETKSGKARHFGMRLISGSRQSIATKRHRQAREIKVQRTHAIERK